MDNSEIGSQGIKDFHTEEEKCTDNDEIPTRFCKYCGTPIKWESYDNIKILHPNSFFYWERKVTRKWYPVDFYTGEKHRCHCHHRIEEEVAA